MENWTVIERDYDDNKYECNHCQQKGTIDKYTIQRSMVGKQRYSYPYELCFEEAYLVWCNKCGRLVCNDFRP